MKSVLISIQPYWVFLIIARLMDWDIPQRKTIEVRKDFPKDVAWDKVAYIYCSKNKKSLNRIPKDYQPLMAKFLGKVLGEFVCDGIVQLFENFYDLQRSCLSWEEIQVYAKGKSLYGWHISDLKIYDKPKELKDIATRCTVKSCIGCEHYDLGDYYNPPECRVEGFKPITRPPQSWCYIEE